MTHHRPVAPRTVRLLLAVFLLSVALMVLADFRLRAPVSLVFRFACHDEFLVVMMILGLSVDTPSARAGS